MSEQKEEKLFKKIGEDLDDEYAGPQKIESLCMNCEENGETRILMVSIPHFREVIVSSFYCDHCGYKNSEVQFGGQFYDKGKKFTLKCSKPEDLNRQIVRSTYSQIRIPEIDFENVPGKEKGSLSTIEGILTKIKGDLEKLQPLRKIQQPKVYEKIENFFVKVDELLEGKKEFTVILDDPSGNSSIEPKVEEDKKKDDQLFIEYYSRTEEQDKMLGLGLTHDDDSTVQEKDKKKKKAKKKGLLLTNEDASKLMSKFGNKDEKELKEVMRFKDYCNNCNKEGECRMIVTEIPHFKEIVLMAFTCDHCGFRTNEVKPGGAISEKGRRTTLKITTEEDLCRDVLKAESAAIFIPEIELEITEGSMGGKFTTIEGLLISLIEQLENTTQYSLGDSQENKKTKSMFSEFIQTLNDYAKGKKEFTLIVDDPLSNSYVQNLYAPDPDPNMTVEDYERTNEQNEEWGLNDIKVENYE